MLRSILKLWSNNVAWFPEAVRLQKEKAIDGVELYNNVSTPLDWEALKALKDANVVAIHNPHGQGWHDFFLTDEQHAHWEQTKELADFFHATRIIVHPARTHNRETFFENMQKLDDSRVHIENMAGLDINREPMQFGATLEELADIRKQIPICFDLEKAVKAACREKVDYKRFIKEGIETLESTYFHVSGGSSTDAKDEHLNLWEGDIDFVWIKQRLVSWAQDKEVFLAFEVPKKDGLANDVKNVEFFRKL